MFLAFFRAKSWIVATSCSRTAPSASRLVPCPAFCIVHSVFLLHVRLILGNCIGPFVSMTSEPLLLFLLNVVFDPDSVKWPINADSAVGTYCCLVSSVTASSLLNHSKPCCCHHLRLYNSFRSQLLITFGRYFKASAPNFSLIRWIPDGEMLHEMCIVNLV